jgi:hypothetical protein
MKALCSVWRLRSSEVLEDIRDASAEAISMIAGSNEEPVGDKRGT